jgi:hypothetical protein
VSSTARRPSARSYILGNTVVLSVGILAAYAALLLGHGASPETLDPRTSDFLQYFSAGRMVLDGHPADMYRWGPMLHMEHRLAFPYALPVHTFQPWLIYPPFTALIFAPLAALPFDVARLLWFLLSAVALSFALYLISRIASLSPRADLILRVATFISLPLVQTLREGQVTVFLLLALLAAYILTLQGRAIPAGLCLAVFTVKPQYAIPIVLVLAIRRYYAVLASFAGWLLLLFAVPAVLFGPDTVLGYLRDMAGLRNGGPIFNSVSESIYGLAQQTLPRSMVAPVWAAASILVIAYLLWYARRAPSLRVPFALSIVAALLISPHLLLHELVLLLLPAAVAMREANRRGLKIGWPLAAVYFAILAAIPLSLVISFRITTFAILGLGAVLVSVSRPASAAVEPAVPEETPSGLALSGVRLRSQAENRTQLPELGGSQEVGGDGEGGPSDGQLDHHRDQDTQSVLGEHGRQWSQRHVAGQTHGQAGDGGVT